MDWGPDLSGCLQEFATTATMFLKFFSLDMQLFNLIAFPARSNVLVTMVFSSENVLDIETQ
uniref:Uncharacterized protein n=1 Tax=Salix viminalis TaxID=40686 RepID=A0A6N2K3R0_SALVM